MAVEALKLNDAREIGALLMQLGAFEVRGGRHRGVQPRRVLQTRASF